MRNKIKKYIEEQELLNLQSKIIVGLSGGADSVVLLSILHALGYECVAAHCNFHLRGKESDQDECFAADYAVSLGVPFLKIDFDTQFIASERKISIEMAARDLRYDWFEQLRKEYSADAIAVAHHQDDCIETLLLNLIRGTGISGLTGIKPRNGFIVRPMLCVGKGEVLQYARKNEIPYQIDSSNLKDEYTRNKIRLQLLPLLQSLNPSVDTSLLRTMEHLNEVSKIYQTHIKEVKEKVWSGDNKTIHIPALLTCPSPESVLFEILKEYDFGKEVIQDVYQALESQSGKKFYSGTYSLIKDRDYFRLISLEQLEENLVYYINEDETERTFPLPMKIFTQERANVPEIIKDKRIAYFDADKLEFPLVLRKWEKGDRFIPFGMNGSQKLSDYFNDHKFTKPDKENTWILCSGQEIIWVVGQRTDNRFRITSETKRIRTIKLL